MTARVRTVASQSLAVLLHGQHVADLVRGTGRLGARLHYVRSDVQPLSISLRTGRRPHAAEKVTPWLQGLLPDDGRVLSRWTEAFDLPDSTPFSILSSPVGRDCAGAVQFCRHEEIDYLRSRPGSLDPLRDDEFEAIISALHNDSLAWLGDPTSLQFSLSGGETKTALHCAGQRWFKPSGATPSTHILKPELKLRRFDDLPLNEHLCQTAARNLGLPAAHTQIADIGGIQTVIIERFDRSDTQGEFVRLHQEDLCQALGLPPSKKYENKGGPTIANLAGVLRKHSTDAHGDLNRYRDALIFNWLIAGSDAHAKNYSVFLDSDSARLAPLYDLASGLPYRDDYNDVQNIRLAQKIGRGYTLRRSDRRSAWSTTSHALGLPESGVLDRAEQLAEEIYGAFELAVEDLPEDLHENRTVNTLLRHLHRRSRVCSSVRYLVGPDPEAISSSDGKPERGSETTLTSKPGRIKCGQRTGKNKICQRTLLNSVCPIHADSPGSRHIRQQQTEAAKRTSKAIARQLDPELR